MLVTDLAFAGVKINPEKQYKAGVDAYNRMDFKEANKLLGSI